MGIKIIITNIFFVMALTLQSCTISNDNNLNQKEIIDGKGIALCKCFRYMGGDDSLSMLAKDVSLRYFIEFSTFSIDEMWNIDTFVEQNIGDFWGIPKGYPLYNMIVYSCWKLYESERLDSFVKELIKKRDDGKFVKE